MIEIMNVDKSYGDFKAVNNVSMTIREGEVFGLVGTNGAGKSTLMRMIAGVLLPEKGSVCLDDCPVYDNPETKKHLFFASDEAFFFPGATPAFMRDYYSQIYEGFDKERFDKLTAAFGLDQTRKVEHFSKGMKKQLSILLGICSGTKYLLLDETFDGLDPVIRQSVKSLFAQDMEDRGLTPVLTSHNLRELEDICDHVGLLHQGGILLSENLQDMKLNLQKVQVVFASEEEQKKAESSLKIVSHSERGRLHTYTLRGEREEVEGIFRGVQTIFYEALALTLEEIFISETEGVGYDVRKFILE